MSNSQHAQVEQLILNVLHDLQKTGGMIDPSKIAIDVDLKIDPNGDSASLKTYLSVGHLKDISRRLLRKKLDPIEIAKEHFKNGTVDMFEGYLQQHYPVIRSIGGEATHVYIANDLLTEFDVAKISKSMAKSIQGLQKHKDAFDAYHCEMHLEA